VGWTSRGCPPKERGVPFGEGGILWRRIMALLKLFDQLLCLDPVQPIDGAVGQEEMGTQTVVIGQWLVQ
jgi:hypothetical protein